MIPLIKSKKLSLILPLLGLLLIGFIIFPFLRLTIATYQFLTPQAILTLGGSPDRESFTAQFALSHPNLPIWVSSGAPPSVSQSIFDSVGISSRVTLDYRAVDTVTNFTTLIKDFQKRHIHHIYLITSDFHISRATAIATIVLGSQGIGFTAVSIPSSQSPESVWHITRDILRSYLWVISSRTGASITLQFKTKH